MSKNNDFFATDIALARKWYEGKTTITGTPLILHSLDAASILKRHHKQVGGVDSKNFRILYLAILGHDIFEDTKVTEKDIEKHWGRDVANLIALLTNLRGDKDFSEYIKVLSKSKEDVRLVKLVDILSNLNNSLREFDKLDKKWIATFWIPLLTQYNDKLLPVPWKKYKELAFSLTREIQRKIILLKKKSASSPK